MKAHTSTFKENIKTLGREIDSKISYELDGETIELGKEQLNSITPHYEADILKSVMKQLDIDSNEDIPVGTEINYKFGVKTRSGKNLLNIDNWVKGRINNSTGNIEYASNVSSMTIGETDIKFIVSQAWNSGIASDFIPISTGTYAFTFSHNREISVYIDTYNNQNVRLSRVVSYTQSASPTTRIFTISDSNVKYIRIHFEVNTANTEYVLSEMQLEKGNQATSYEKYGAYDYLDYGNYIIYSSEKQEDTRSYKIVAYDKMLYAMKDYSTPITRNLFNKNASPHIAGSYIANDGTIVSNAEFSIYKIDVKPNQYYTLTNNGDSYAPGLCYFNSNDERLDGIGYQGRANITFRTPESTNYILMSAVTMKTNRYDLDIMQLEEGNQATSYVSHLTEYPITIKSYLENICRTIGLTLKDTTFVNQDKELTSELYLDADGNSLNYTYRDVLDEIAGATASTICINEDDELEVRYITTTQGKNLLNMKDGNFVWNNTHTWNIKNQVVDFSCNNISYQGGAINLSTGLTSQWAGGRKTDEHLTTNGGTYTLSCIRKGEIQKGTNGFLSLYYHLYKDDGTNTSVMVNVTYEELTTKEIVLANDQHIGCIIVYSQYVSCENVKIRIQLESGNQRTDYEPYGDTINEEYLKDINVNFGEKYGPVNSVVFSRSAESDNIFRQDTESVETNGLTEIKIVDNQILNGNNRDEFIDGVFNQLNGFEYYVNDYSSTGIAYYDLCDRYNVKVEDNIYSCVMLNDELLVTQGLEENVHTDMPEDSETDYKKADKTDRRINQAYLIVDKQNQEINAVVQTINEVQNLVNENNEQVEALGTRLTQTTNNITASITSLQSEIDNGVGLVKTTMVTIDDNGLNVSTDTSKISTSMTNDAFTINSSDKELAFFGYDKDTGSTRAEMDNLTITNYLTAGYHRIEKFERDGEQRTGYFYIGGR